MTHLHRNPLVALILAVPLLLQMSGCAQSNPSETISVSLKNTQTYEYPTVGGDEEGARISTQARHYSISEIRRDESTNFVAVYVYRPAPGFVGSDYAEIEILTGSPGATGPTKIRRVAFHFAVGN